MLDDKHFIQKAFEQARQSYDEGGIPIGCVLVKNDQIVGCGRNRRVQCDSAVLHAEIDAFEETGRQNGAFYKNVTLYTTLSPCAMCSGAILLYGIPRVVIGENDSFKGDESLLSERGVGVAVLDDADCIALMRRFMTAKPELWSEDIGR